MGVRVDGDCPILGAKAGDYGNGQLDSKLQFFLQGYLHVVKVAPLAPVNEPVPVGTAVVEFAALVMPLAMDAKELMTSLPVGYGTAAELVEVPTAFPVADTELRRDNPVP